jgi:hypothetical protein
MSMNRAMNNDTTNVVVINSNGSVIKVNQYALPKSFL